ncbi:hypothetical protein GCM10028809_60980 [Spirosoma gilvum]
MVVAVNEVTYVGPLNKIVLLLGLSYQRAVPTPQLAVRLTVPLPHRSKFEATGVVARQSQVGAVTAVVLLHPLALLATRVTL